MKRTVLSAFAVFFVFLFLLSLVGCGQENGETSLNPPESADGPAIETEPVLSSPEPELHKPVETCVMLGDSITAQGDFQAYFESVTVINLGIPGDTIVGVTERFGQAAELSPDLLMILCGINSLSDDTLEKSLAEYGLLAGRAADLPEETRVVIQSVLPADEAFMIRKSCSDGTIRAFNDGLREIAEKSGFDYLDLYSDFAVNGAMDPELTTDGLHLNKKGYDLWAERIRTYMEVRDEEDAP